VLGLLLVGLRNVLKNPKAASLELKLYAFEHVLVVRQTNQMIKVRRVSCFKLFSLLPLFGLGPISLMVLPQYRQRTDNKTCDFRNAGLYAYVLQNVSGICLNCLLL
jgi:hypothetical protein